MATKKKLDFSKMIFDVSKVENGESVLDTFPRLKVYSEIDADMPIIDKVLRFVFLLYDVNSPFQEHKSLKERQELCLEYAGFEREKTGYFGMDVLALIEDDEVKNISKVFLFKIQNHRKFNLYVSMERALEDTIENIGSPIIEQESQKKESAWKTRFGNCDGALQLLLNVEKLEKDIFQEKEEIKELVSTSDKQESNFKAGMAEGMARKFASTK